MPQPPKPSALVEWVTKNPVPVTIGFIASVAGILAFVFPTLTAPKRDLRYVFADKVYTNQTTKVKFALWNAGDEPIKHDDILKPVTVHFENVKIEKAEIIKITRDVTGFSSTVTDPAQLNLNWSILERDDGALIQLTIAGISHVYSIDGTIVGRTSPRLGTEHHPYYFFVKGLFRALGFCAAALGLILMGFSILSIIKGGKVWLTFKMAVLFSIVGSLFLFVSYWSRPISPFGF